VLDWLIPVAHAQQAAPPNAFVQFMPLVLLVIVFYFLLIRPQMKRNKEHKQLIASLAKGDEVITSGGITGRITTLGEAYVGVEVAPGVEVKVQKPAISSVLPKGSLKAL
jgi:preprotein translocase subunit YajC